MIRAENECSTDQLGCFFTNRVTYSNSRTALVSWLKPFNENRGLRLISSLSSVHQIGWFLYYSMFNGQGFNLNVTPTDLLCNKGSYEKVVLLTELFSNFRPWWHTSDRIFCQECRGICFLIALYYEVSLGDPPLFEVHFGNLCLMALIWLPNPLEGC